MLRGTKQTCFQRGYPKGQQVHGKMLNPPLISMEVQIKMTMRYHFTSAKGYHQEGKREQVLTILEKRETLCTVGGNVNWSSH